MIVVHLKTQRNQPYGSERRCCEECGVMIWYDPPPNETWTDKPEDWLNLPEGYVRCTDAKKYQPRRS